MPRHAVPTILAIDTAGTRCSLALLRAGRMQVHQGGEGSTHLEQVVPQIEALFARCGAKPIECDAFAFACGPGSFTGLRVACTVVQGLALGAGRPVVPVGHLEALRRAAQTGATAAARARGAEQERAVALIDARLDEAYWAVYERGDDAWHSCQEAVVGGREALRGDLLRWRPDWLAGKAAWIRGYIGDLDLPIREAAVEASIVATIAGERLARGETLAPERALPLYVRDRVALTVEERRAGRASEDQQAR